MRPDAPFLPPQMMRTLQTTSASSQPAAVSSSVTLTSHRLASVVSPVPANPVESGGAETSPKQSAQGAANSGQPLTSRRPRRVYRPLQDSNAAHLSALPSQPISVHAQAAAAPSRPRVTQRSCGPAEQLVFYLKRFFLRSSQPKCKNVAFFFFKAEVFFCFKPWNK